MVGIGPHSPCARHLDDRAPTRILARDGASAREGLHLPGGKRLLQEVDGLARRAVQEGRQGRGPRERPPD
jgi:hypothetical protein